MARTRRIGKRWLGLGIALWLASATAPAAAGATVEPYLVRDLSTGGDGSFIDAGGLAAAGGFFFFALHDGPNGNELWRTDGTAAGTFLLRDICPGSCDSDPEAVLVLGDRLVFLAETPEFRRELWATDGTTEGTVPLGAAVHLSAEVLASYEDTGRMIFTARSTEGPISAVEPWVTDGTPAGTESLAPGVDLEFGGARAVHLESRRLVVFLGRDGQGREPWVTDGTRPGTRRLRDLAAGAGDSNPRPLFVAGDRLLFAATSSTSGRELWVTDGTPAGTELVRDLAPGAGSSDFRASSSLADGGIFSIATGVFEQLWFSDGTAAGTRALTGPGSLRVDEIEVLGDWAVIRHGIQLWLSDGTAAGTAPVESLLLSSPVPNRPSLHPAAGRVFFVGRNAQEPSNVSQPWATDGTPAGTVQLLDAFRCCSGFPYPHVGTTFRPLGNRMQFLADDGVFGNELWISDGTVAGTERATDVCPGGCDSFFSGPAVAFGSHAFFAASEESREYRPWALNLSSGTSEPLCSECSSDPSVIGAVGDRLVFSGLQDSAADGGGFWITDGTAGGTLPLIDAQAHPDLYARPFLGETENGAVLFSIPRFDRAGTLWRTDGTQGGTAPLRELEGAPGDSAPARLTAFGDGVAFRAVTDSRYSIWYSDGSPAGTRRLTPFDASLWMRAIDDRLFFFSGSFSSQQLWVSGPAPGSVRQLTTSPVSYLGARPEYGLGIFRDELYFWLEEVDRLVLWASDGTPAGTREVDTVQVRPDHSGEDDDRYSAFGAVGDRLLFAGADLLSPSVPRPMALWRTSGAAGSTRQLTGSEGPEWPARFVSLSGELYFRAADGLWRSDGTAGGTVPLVTGLSSADQLTVAGGQLFFTAVGASTAEENLWVSDGTAAGSRLLARFTTLGAYPERGIRELTALGDELFFVADDGESGAELWASDGTVAGTRRVVDLYPGPRSSQPNWLEAAGGSLFFAASDGDSGYELWQTDGTAAGTRLVADIAAGPGSSNPAELTASAGRLFFRANGGEAGDELWALPLSPGVPSLGSLATPRGLAARARSATEALVSWEDRSLEEARFVVEVSSPAGFVRLAELPQGAETYEAAGLSAGTPYTFRVRAERGEVASEWAEISLRMPGSSTACGDPRVLCLLGDRFRVQVDWRDQRSGDFGRGTAEAFPGSQATGLFWFFDAANIELIVKALDGRPVNGFFWAFYGALSDVEYWVTVDDTVDGGARTYHNPPGEICGRGDTTAFPGGSALLAPLGVTDPAAAPAAAAAADGGECTPGTDALCLLGGRFQVQVEWRDPRSGDEGTGRAVPGSDKTGYFWFFDEENIELVVKALDGRAVNGRFWLFYGALSDVEYTITVTDTETATVQTYTNPAGEICGRADTAAF